MKPLSVGNVISAGLRIYKDHFKVYYSLAFTAYLWLIVPIYGWAKFLMINGLISRLAYGEVAEKPEQINDARRHVKPRMWGFLGNAIVASLIGIIGFIVILLVFGLIGFILSSLGFDSLFLQIGFSLIIGIAVILAFIFGLTWLVSRLMLSEIPLAIENNVTAIKSIGRGWELTAGFVFKLQLIVFLAFLLSLPISIIINILAVAIQGLLTYLAQSAPDIFPIVSLLLALLQIAVAFASGALFIPFWQSIKAVIYYDLRVRKEGLGLELQSEGDFFAEQ